MNGKLIILGLGILVFGLAIVSFPIQSVSAADAVFSIVWITDTQFLSQSYPSDFDTACAWIVNNAATLNVKAVIHTGDLVETDWDSNQWANAAHSMGLLLDNNIPYSWCAGNHDTLVSQDYPAFNLSAMRTKPYWVSDYNSGKNTATSFNASGQEILILDIEYMADSSVLQWANNLLNNDPSASVIIGTHSYLDPQYGYNSWATNFQNTLLNAHSNVFLTLSGHFGSEPYTSRTKVGTRDELHFDRQDAEGSKGAATLRILTYDTTANMISVKTYNTLTNSYLTDSNNQFTLQVSFAVPELLPWMILPFLMVATTLAASLFKKKPS